MEPVREGELHPLQNHNILEVIFKVLKLNDLKSCRLVCREWSRGSTEAMEKMSASFWVKIFNADGRRISDFLEMVRVEGEENAFAAPSFMEHYKISSLEGDSRTFWESCGVNIKALHLGGVLFESGDIFRHAIFQSCQNLEKLVLCGVRVSETNAEEPKEWVPPLFPPNRNLKSLQIVSRIRLGGVSWMEVLSQFPALEKFEANDGGRYLTEFFGSLAIARRHNNQCWKINDLKLDNASLSMLEALTLEDSKLPLETLNVSVMDRSEEIIELRRILIVYAPTLRNLSLAGRSVFRDPALEIIPPLNNVVFENVTKLSLTNASLPSVSFLQWFPNLKKLDLVDLRPGREFSQEPAGNWILDNCTDLTVNLGYFKSKDVRELLSKLPNLETLKVCDSNNDMFQVICELLPKLVHLELRRGQVDDTGISGLDEEDVSRINEKGQSLWPISVARPNLTSLKNLERFRMSGSIKLPGFTSALCVEQLPHLQQFSVPAYRSFHIYHHLQIRFPWRSQ